MNKNKLIKPLTCITIISLIIMIYTIIHQTKQSDLQFIPPENDSLAIIGLPEGEYTLSKLGEYEFGINPHPYIQNGNIYINFYNGQDNDIFMKVRVFKEEEVMTESGIIKPGESIEIVNLKQEIDEQSKLIYKIMCYEKETYYSAGSGIIKLDTMIIDE